MMKEYENTILYGLRAVKEAVASGKEFDRVFVQKGLTSVLFGELRTVLEENKIPYQFVPAEKLNQALAQTAKNGTRLTMVFTEGEPLLREMEEERHLPAAGDLQPFQCIRVTNAGHTFRPLWAQQEIHRLLDREVEALLGAAHGTLLTGSRKAVLRR